MQTFLKVRSAVDACMCAFAEVHVLLDAGGPGCNVAGPTFSVMYTSAPCCEGVP